MSAAHTRPADATAPRREPSAAPSTRSSGFLQRKCGCGATPGVDGDCETCRRKRLPLQRRAAVVPTRPEPAELPAAVHDVLRTPGAPLDPATRQYIEPRFGHDFGHVRVHTGSQAAESARAVNARAYTVGRHVVFDAGQYSPATNAGRHLLAHELAHVVQQSRGGPPPPLDRHASYERAADAAATAATATPAPARPVAVSGATVPGLARQTAPATPLVVPAVTAAELFDRLVLSVRGFASSPSGIPEVDPAGVGGAIGRGYETYAAIQLIDREGNQILTGIGQYVGSSAHAEAAAIAALKRALPPGIDLAGARMMVVVDQVPCPNCASALDAFAQEMGIAEMTVHVPTRPSVRSPNVPVSPKTAARTAMQAGRDYTMRLEATKTFSGKPSGTPTTSPATEPVPVEPLPVEGAPDVPAAESPAAPTTAPSAVKPQAGPVRVETAVRVVSSVERPGGGVISEVEIVLGDGLENVNRGAPAGGALPGRMLLRISQNPDGALAAAESLTGEPAALAEGLAQQLLARGQSAAPASTAGAVAGNATEGVTGAAEGTTAATEGASTAAAGGARSLLLRGARYGGTAVFVVLTGYQLITATPEQRPRVAVKAAGGFAGGVVGSYLVCNALLDIETVGWGIVICGFIAGGAAGYAGSEVAGDVYDDVTALPPLEQALRDLEHAPVNVRRLFYSMVASASGGLPITADFVHRFASIVPADLRDSELYLLAGQLRGLGPTSTLDSVLQSLAAAVNRLPPRLPLLPPALPNFGLAPNLTPNPFLFDPRSSTDWSRGFLGPGRIGIPLTDIGPGRIVLFPGLAQPLVGLPTEPWSQSPGIIRIDLGR